ncbi:c-type cytochrome [Paeniroseomonas aquatica]|uniref:c-type cytochrome n=1 Tax=Paeniroseomonas aquatica TaxID=373043 RepID=UPI00360C8B1D
MNALATLPDGTLASAGEDARIALWPAGSGDAPARVLEGHTAPIAALAAGPDGTLASAGWDATLRLWSPGGTSRVLEGHRGPVNAVTWTPRGWVSAGYDGTIRLWDAQGSRTLAGFGVPRNALLALPDGLAAAGADGALRRIGADGTLQVLTAGTLPLVALAATADGATIAAASLGGSVTLWSEDRLRGTLDGPGSPVWSLAFAADGRTLWTGGQDRLVRRWDVATGTPLGPLANAMAAPAAPAAFRACAACHALTAEAQAMAGPHLQGLFGRRMGSLPGYAYSPRLAQGDIVWTPETVADLFTRGPDVVTPGTRMPVQTLGNADEMAALIRFLREATR